MPALIFCSIENTHCQCSCVTQVVCHAANNNELFFVSHILIKKYLFFPNFIFYIYMWYPISLWKLYNHEQSLRIQNANGLLSHY